MLNNDLEKDIFDLSKDIDILWSITSKLPREISIRVRFYLAELYCKARMAIGALKIEDLTNKSVLAVAQDYLNIRYPNLDLKKNPAEFLLYRRAEDLRQFIDNLVYNDYEFAHWLKEFEKLSDEAYLKETISKLATIYPDLDLSTDPAQILLQGERRESFDEFLDELVS